ncbi:hypothetical protein SCALM49S_00991 [Streptomyces californicus]
MGAGAALHRVLARQAVLGPGDRPGHWRCSWSEKVRPLHADPFVGNTGSVRLLEKHGFRRTGTVRYGGNEHVMLVLDENRAQEGV